MKIMVVGGGGREHAIIKKLKENPAVSEIYALPGNGGITADAVCVNIGAKDIDGQVKFALENKIDYAVVAPDDPLVLGAVDALTAAGIPCFGPDKKAAIIEGSKVFSKNLMKKYGIPDDFKYLCMAESGLDPNVRSSAGAAGLWQLMPPFAKSVGLFIGTGVDERYHIEKATEAAGQRHERWARM